MIILFGKYKGTEFSDLPTDYLHWIEGNCEMKYRLEAQEELLRRKNPGSGKTTKKAELPWLEELYVLLQKMPDTLLNKPLKCGDYIIHKIVKVS